MSMTEIFGSHEPNLTGAERTLYVVLGLGLAAAAAKPRPNPMLNALALAGGAYLAWRGAEGYCPVKSALFGNQAHLIGRA
jgi:threonine/homoserine/homoserine lactone efflux protein